jgi:uncharacterized FAD-dependent dehydrogenase
VKTTEILILPSELNNSALHKIIISENLSLPVSEIGAIELIKRSVDARSKTPKFVLRYNVFLKNEIPEKTLFKINYNNVENKPSVAIIGFGPAGMFAALRMLELGIKPIIIEKGKDVKSRRRDIAAIHKNGIINSNSNYCFGEGGAGTFSDGKLYTRSTKRGDVNYILETLVMHGASPDILIDAHPHIGTNRLPNVVSAIRDTIKKNGGEIYFNSELTDIELKQNKISSILTSGNKQIITDNIILATGHSARNIFYLLHNKKIEVNYKPFAIGVRVEHPQEIIDKIQYHCNNRHENLPPASYKLIHQHNKRGVYSFCMCPGGVIAPCATNPGEIVTNGWSPSKRNNPFANSGIVAEIKKEDIAHYGINNPFAGLLFQQELEKKMFQLAENDSENLIGQKAPAQRLNDFVNGIFSNQLHKELPHSIAIALRESFKAFGKKMKGFLSNDAMVVAIESRTSSPIQIPRNPETLEHIRINGLYPCGEGAGYAGGIVSAAIDGVKCADAIAKKLNA